MRDRTGRKAHGKFRQGIFQKHGRRLLSAGLCAAFGAGCRRESSHHIPVSKVPARHNEIRRGCRIRFAGCGPHRKRRTAAHSKASGHAGQRFTDPEAALAGFVIFVRKPWITERGGKSNAHFPQQEA
jgi:hypothetical protein